MLTFFGIWLGAGVVLMLIFHFSNRNAPAAPVPPERPAPEPGKLISKKEAWADRPSYDYDRTSSMGNPVSPVEPGDSGPPEPYE